MERIDLSFVKYEESREIGTLLYNIRNSEIEIWKVISHTNTMFEVINLENGCKKKSRFSGNTWYTKEGVLREAKEIVANLQEDIVILEKTQ